MADKNIACGNFALAFSGSDWAHGTDNAGVAGYSSGYKVAILRFDVPSIPGVAKLLDVGVVVSKVATTGATVRWALCKSDANREKYLDTTAEVADENQIASGTLLFENLTNVLGLRTFQIPCKGLRKGTWYLILWASELKGIYMRSITPGYGNSFEEYAISATFTGGGVWIQTADGPKAVGVYDGTRKRLTLHAEYIKTGSGSGNIPAN